MTLSTAILDEGERLLAAAADLSANLLDHAIADTKYIAWLRTYAADLIASARQAQDNAKDAERYRFLRDDESGLSVRDVFSAWCPQLNDGLDAAIDAAIAAATPGKGEG